MGNAAEHRLERRQRDVDDRDVQDRHDGADHDHARDLQDGGIDVVGQFRLQGYEPLLSTPDEMSARIKTEIATWTKVIRDAGIQPQ